MDDDSRGPHERGTWPLLALATPACLLAAGLGVALVMAAFGYYPMWSGLQWNLSEAAAVRDVAEVARLIEEGEDPNAARDIRAGLLSEATVRLTPLEAAVVANDENMVMHLLDSGAVINTTRWNRLHCLADGDEIRRVLDERRPPDADSRCERASQ